MKPQVVISVCLWEAGVEVEMVGQGLFHHLTFEKTCAHFFAQMSQCLKELKAEFQSDIFKPLFIAVIHNNYNTEASQESLNR